MSRKIERYLTAAFIIVCSLWVLLMMVWMTLVMFGVMDFPSVYVCS